MPILSTGSFLSRESIKSEIVALKIRLRVAREKNKEDHPAAIEWRERLELLEATEYETY